jgi:hypothetical protein
MLAATAFSLARLPGVAFAVSATTLLPISVADARIVVIHVFVVTVAPFLSRLLVFPTLLATRCNRA